MTYIGETSLWLHKVDQNLKNFWPIFNKYSIGRTKSNLGVCRGGGTVLRKIREWATGVYNTNDGLLIPKPCIDTKTNLSASYVSAYL